MLERVFYNLFDNAVRHGERLTNISVGCRQVPEGLVIAIEDNRVGILQDEKEKIFGRGYGKNTGFGSSWHGKSSPSPVSPSGSRGSLAKVRGSRFLLRLGHTGSRMNDRGYFGRARVFIRKIFVNPGNGLMAGDCRNRRKSKKKMTIG